MQVDGMDVDVAPSLAPSPDKVDSPGLVTGDVLLLHTQSGQPLAITRVDDEDGSPLWVLASSAGDHPGACVQVLQQGIHYAFASPAAGGRLLSVRRRGAHRMVFASQHLGGAEQWLLLQPAALQAPWRTTPLILQNRKMPQVVLHMAAERVGHQEVVLPGPAPPGTPTSTDIVEHEELEKMRGVLVHEWVHFVNAEKQRRRALEARLAALHGDLDATKQWALEQLHGLRDAMQAELDTVIGVVNQRNTRVVQLKQWLHKRLLWGVRVMQRHNENEVKREVILWWREVAREKRHWQHVLETLFMHTQRRLLATAMHGWLHHTRTLAAARAEAARMTDQRRRALLLDAVVGWRDLVEAKHAQRARLAKAVMRLAACRLRWALHVWQAHTEEALDAAEETADAEVAAHVALEAGCRKLQRLRLRQVLTAWQRHSEQQQRRQAGMQALLQQRIATMVERCFDEWRACVAARRAQTAVAESYALARAERRQHQTAAAAMEAWRAWVARRLQLEVAASRVQARSARRVVLQAWQAWQQHTATVAARRPLLERCLRTWEHTEAAAAMQAWREGVQVARRHRHALEVVVEQRARGLMGAALAAWVAHARRQRQLRVAAERVRAIQTRRLLQRCFDGWHGEWAASAAARANLQRCMLAKRVAFRAFKRWYWESFEGDVQTTVSKLFGVTEQAAQSDGPSDSMSDAELDALLAGVQDAATEAHWLGGGSKKGGLVGGADGEESPPWSIPSSPPMLRGVGGYVPLSTAMLQVHTPPVHLPGLTPGSTASPPGVQAAVMYHSSAFMASSGGESEGESSPLRMPMAKLGAVREVDLSK